MQNKRMFVHDYRRVGFYMVTILSADRRPLFGVCRDSGVVLSPAGEIVERRWHEIPSHRPSIETSTLIVMPDHLHGILYVKEQLRNPWATRSEVSRAAPRRNFERRSMTQTSKCGKRGITIA